MVHNKSQKLKMPYEFISFTQLSTYDNCPRWYKLHYFDKVEKPKSDAMAFGSLLHEAIKRVNNLIKKSEGKSELDLDEVKEIYESEFGKRKFDFGTYQRGLACLLDYAEKTFKSVASIFKLEYEVTLKLTDGKNETELKGIIDRIDNVEGGLEIIDFKSGAMMPSRDEVDDNLQLNIYAFILSKRFPGYKIYTSIYPLGAGIKITVEKNIEKLDWVEDYVVGLWKKIGSDKKFEARINKWCFSCPAKNTCEVYRELISGEMEALESPLAEIPNRLEKVKTNLSVLAKEKEALTDRLKAEIDNKMGEPLELNGWKFELINRHRASYVVPESDYQELKARKIASKV